MREWYPDVQVIETDRVPESVQGCVDHKRRIIWLSDSLSHGERRATLAFEVGQLELGPFDRDRGDAGMVYHWASRLLIPFADLLRAFERFEELPELAEELWVDAAMLRTRLWGLTDEERALLPPHFVG